MNENTQLKAFLAFLFIFSAMALSQAAMAAAVVSPVVPGLAGGMYSAPAGSFTMAAANSGFIQPAFANVGGKAITVPATLRMAQNAGQYAKNAMKLNPWAIAGTLAAGWLLDQGMQWMADTQQWGKTDPNAWGDLSCYIWNEGNTNVQKFSCVQQPSGNWLLEYCLVSQGCIVPHSTVSLSPSGAVSTLVPATDGDWDSLPDPLPAIAPELPYAPYMPEGVPVEVPDYDFQPFSTPMGDPYTKPDGSTAQPMAKVSPNGDKVTVDTYDEPLTDPQGNPVPDPQPQDTQEPEQSECQKHPTTIGCAEFGAPPAMETIPTTEIPIDATVTPVGGGGACPASVTVRGITWSYAPICDFASAVRPFIIGFAWLGFAYIVAGVVRS